MADPRNVRLQNSRDLTVQIRRVADGAIAVEGGYRVYEAERARQLSARIGYHWGQVDADEALAAMA